MATERPLLLSCASTEEQAEFVAEQILRLREDLGIDYRRMAVLYRAHNNRLEVELELTQRGIPFVVRGGLRFFEQAHIKDLMAFLMVLGNGRDELAWQRILGMCNRVGPKTIAGVMSVLKTAQQSEGGLLGKFTHQWRGGHGARARRARRCWSCAISCAASRLTPRSCRRPTCSAVCWTGATSRTWSCSSRTGASAWTTWSS